MFALKTLILLVLKAEQKYSKLMRQVGLICGLKTTQQRSIDFDFKMQLRARNVTRTFEKRAPGLGGPSRCLKKCVIFFVIRIFKVAIFYERRKRSGLGFGGLGEPRKRFLVDQKLHVFKKWRLQCIIECNNFLEGF